MRQNGTSRRFPALVTAAAAGLLLAGCTNYSPLDDLKVTSAPSDSEFSQALFQDYAFLARSFGDVGQAGYTTFDQAGSVSLADSNSDLGALANAYASKALQLSKDLPVDPEPSRDLPSHTLRDRLVRALDKGRDEVPRDAARAQADYDCWMLNSNVAFQARAAAACRASLDITLPRLEAEVHAMPQSAEGNAPTTAVATAPLPDAAPATTAQ